MFGIEKKKKFINLDSEIPEIPEQEIGNLYKFDNQWVDYHNLISSKALKAKGLKKKISILFIADLHNDIIGPDFTNQLVTYAKKSDVCILLGDISESNLEKTFYYIKHLVPIYGIVGNHDRDFLLQDFGIESLHKKVIKINNIIIAGMDGSIRYNDYCQNVFSHKESIDIAREIPAADILVSHDIPYSPEWPGSITHKGMIGLTQYLYSYGVPYNIHGHLHNTLTDKLPNGTTCVGVYKAAFIQFPGNIFNYFD